MNERTNCPNCGAPIEHRYNHQCSYCGTFFDYRVEKTKEINPRYMTNVKVKSIEKSYLKHNIQVLFEGDYRPFSQALEYGRQSDVFVFDAEEFKNQKVYFRVEVPIVELISSEFNPSCILSCLPFEMDADVILEALWEFEKENRWL